MERGRRAGELAVQSATVGRWEERCAKGSNDEALDSVSVDPSVSSH